MQEFAQKDSATPQGQCPSSENLAAYIDGELGEAERQRITEHLASCEDCYAVYTETLRFQLDTESVFAEGEVLPFRAPKEKRTAAAALRRWYPIAALLLVGVGGGSFHFLALPPGLVPTKLVPPLADPSSVDGRLWLGPTYRGEGGDEESKLDEPPSRMGVQLVNLQASLKAGNVLAAQDVVARILGLLKAQPFTDDLYKAYTGITVALENHKPPSELLPEASRLAKESREVFDPTLLDLGQWVEAGRLAAPSRATRPSSSGRTPRASSVASAGATSWGSARQSSILSAVRASTRSPRSRPKTISRRLITWPCKNSSTKSSTNTTRMRREKLAAPYPSF